MSNEMKDMIKEGEVLKEEIDKAVEDGPVELLEDDLPEGGAILHAGGICDKYREEIINIPRLKSPKNDLSEKGKVEDEELKTIKNELSILSASNLTLREESNCLKYKLDVAQTKVKDLRKELSILKDENNSTEFHVFMESPENAKVFNDFCKKLNKSQDLIEKSEKDSIVKIIIQERLSK